MRVVISTAVVHRCPYREEVDHGWATILWDLDDTARDAPELHGVRLYLDAFSDKSISHEEFTQQLADDLEANVTTKWTTAGMDVECSAVPRDESA